MTIKMLRRRIASVVNRVPGEMGVAVHDVSTGEETGVRENEWFPMASVCKTPILVEAYRRAQAGPMSLDQRVEVTRETRTPGSGLLNYCDEGLRPSLRDLLLLMIVVSDNAATDMVLHALDGPEAVTATMAALGLPNIRLSRSIRELLQDISVGIDPIVTGLDYYQLETLFTEKPELSETFRNIDRVSVAIEQATRDKDSATPQDMARLYGLIARNECASEEACEQILKTLERQQLRGRLPRDLPPHTRCCHKTGTLGNGTVCNDTGLIFVRDRPIAVAVLSKGVKQDQAATNTAIARIGRIVYDYFAA